MATEWFLVCNAELNEHVAAFLVEHGITEAESKCVDLECADGKLRDAWLIPGSLIQKLLDGGRKFPQFKFNFFTRSSQGSLLQSADFIKRKKVTKKLRKARKRPREVTT